MGTEAMLGKWPRGGSSAECSWNGKSMWL